MSSDYVRQWVRGEKTESESLASLNSTENSWSRSKKKIALWNNSNYGTGMKTRGQLQSQAHGEDQR